MCNAHIRGNPLWVAAQNGKAAFLMALTIIGPRIRSFQAQHQWGKGHTTSHTTSLVCNSYLSNGSVYIGFISLHSNDTEGSLRRRYLISVIKSNIQVRVRWNCVRAWVPFRSSRRYALEHEFEIQMWHEINVKVFPILSSSITAWDWGWQAIYGFIQHSKIYVHFWYLLRRCPGSWSLICNTDHHLLWKV